jgi:hypothetical protein
MADDRVHDEPRDDGTYEPPAVESLGSADELAKGNEGSQQDDLDN